MNLAEAVRICKEKNDYSPMIEQVPYAKFLGMGLMRAGDELTFTLEKRESNIGNPTLPALHGGVIAGFLEHAAVLHLLFFMEQPKMPKIIDISIDYLSAGHYRETYAECKVVRLGRKVANVSMKAWQESREQPIAVARAQFLLDAPLI
ncbi:MAG TPA: PaaI family thioesterase [Pseudomonadales bacterium]|nr:PaaI family thioesterase [Pseudomonadales bacterium]